MLPWLTRYSSKSKPQLLPLSTSRELASELAEARKAELERVIENLSSARAGTEESLDERKDFGAHVPSPMDEKRQKERQAVVARAQRHQLEARPEARLMNQMVQSSITMAALDDQVARRAAAREKDAMDAAEAHRRAAADWALKAAMEEEREQEKLLMYKAGEAQLLGQLAERREAAAAALAATLAEGTAQRLAAERMARQEVEGERERRAAGAALLEEVAAFNALRLGRKEAAQRAQRAEDEAIVRFHMEKDAQEQAAFEERQAAVRASEQLLAAHWSSTRRVQDGRRAAEDARIRLYQDEREAAELAKEEAAEALKAQSKSAQLATMKQQLEYKAEAARRAAEEEAAEAVKVSAAAEAAKLAAAEEEAKKKAAAAALRTTLESQLRELAALTEAGRLKEVQEAQAQAAAAEAERNALERLKREKLALLSHVPAKYRVDLERLQVA
ncbi:hypothetical protein ACKKBF_B20385 [Auxenochlorella protothecoides x Auxenochlorella symbiontica]